MCMSRLVDIISGDREVKSVIGYINKSEYPVTVNWNIFKFQHKFLWWTWFSYDYQIEAPFINLKYSLLSVDERNTNIKLEQAVSEVRAELERKIAKMKIEDHKK